MESYRCVDPGVAAAACVAERMRLPFQCPREVVCIVPAQIKISASFNQKNGFAQFPHARGYDLRAALRMWIFTWPGAELGWILAGEYRSEQR